jgi:DNA polymerase/3'-5' exonuclease PolX
MLIRTGSAEFSKAIVTLAPRRGFRFIDGRLFPAIGLPATLACVVLEEGDVFAALGVPWVDPKDRTGALPMGDTRK